MAAQNDFGYVYILTNPSFKEDWVKIGKSSRPVNVRSKELDNTAVPLPFEVYATLKTCKYSEVEKLVHKTIDRLTDLRIRQSREFFNIMPAQALDILKDIAMTLDDAEIEFYTNGVGRVIYPEPEVEVLPDSKSAKPVDDPESKAQRSRFRFSMINVHIGDIIEFIPTGIKVKVASDNQVEYEGRLYKLSPFVGTFMPEEKRNTSGAYQGAKYFKYQGKILEDLRKEMEK